MQTNALKSRKTSNGLGNFYVNDWENGGKIGMGTLYVVFHIKIGKLVNY